VCWQLCEERAEQGREGGILRDKWRFVGYDICEGRQGVVKAHTTGEGYDIGRQHQQAGDCVQGSRVCASTFMCTSPTTRVAVQSTFGCRHSVTRLHSFGNNGPVPVKGTLLVMSHGVTCGVWGLRVALI
jgi:hypothetical protein